MRSATGALLFRTNSGRLDILKEVSGETYETLTTDAVERVVSASQIKTAS